MTAAGEHREWTDMYASFAKTAKEEGFAKISYLFEAVVAISEGADRKEKRFTLLSG